MHTVAQNASDPVAVNLLLFGAICANTKASFKSLATTIKNGVDLLEQGYRMVPGLTPGAYRCTNTEDEVYDLEWTEEGISCSCGAGIWIGTCKHAIALRLNKELIDLEAEAPAATAREFDPSDWK